MTPTISLECGRSLFNSHARLCLVLAALVLSSACAKGGKKSAGPGGLELPPEDKIADKHEDEDAAKATADEELSAEKVEEAPPEAQLVHPQDRDPNQEKAKMERSRQKSATAKQKLRSGQLGPAIEEARAALRDHEQNVQAMLVIAEAFYRQGKHELVLSVTGSILKVDAKVLSPEEKSQAYNLMGFAYLQAGSRTEAYRAFKNAAETDDQNASAWNNLGVQYMWRGEIATAESCFEYAVSLDASFAQAQLNYGAALRANGKLSEASVAFELASKLRPDWAEVHFNLGVLYLDAEQVASLDEIAKLEAAVGHFDKYKSLAAQGNSSIERSAKKRGPTDAMGNELVTVAQADLYITAANKGIESERRKAERDQKRQEREAEKAAEAAAEAEAEAEADTAPQEPAEEAVPPSEQPQEPKPQEPAPQEPAPKKPAPQEPAPKKPSAQKPTPQQPG